MNKRRWFRRIVFGLVLLGTLVVLCYAGLSFWGRREWAQTQAEMRAKGESLVHADFLPRPIPDEENFFATPMWDEIRDGSSKRAANGVEFWEPHIEKDKLRINLFHKVLESEGKRSATSIANKDRGRWPYEEPMNLEKAAEFFRESGRLKAPPTTAGADVLTALEPAREVYEELKVGASRRGLYMQFPGEADSFFAPHARYYLPTSRYLSLRVAAEAAAGLGQEAQEDVTLSLRWADSLKNDPYFISHLVRFSGLTMSATMLWEGLYRQCWDEEQLERLQAEFAKEDVRGPYLRGLRGERAYVVQLIELYARPGGMRDLLKTVDPTAWEEKSSLSNQIVLMFARLYPSGLIFDDLAAHVRFMQKLIDSLEDPKDLADTKALVGPLLEEPRVQLTRFLGSSIRSGLRGSVVRMLEVETQIGQAQVACALERFRLKTGAYPQTLSELGSVPNDPVSQNPFQYKLDGKGGYLLWGMAYNEVNDGGKVGMLRETGDWAWKMPGR